MDISKGIYECGPVDGLNYAYSWRSQAYEVCLLSDVGNKRKHNEDSCLICIPDDARNVSQYGYLLAVADGMGGASSGEYASRMALQVMSNTYYEAPPKPTPIAMREALEVANALIFAESTINPVHSGMGTTLSSLVLRDGWCYIAQVGDSRVYLIRKESGIHQLTHDHSLVAEQVRSGLISEEEARSHSQRNLITHVVGIQESVKIDSFALKLVLGDTILICSDGLSNMVSDDVIKDVLENNALEYATQLLINLALKNGGTDNITALTVHVTEEFPQTPPQPGAEEIKITTPTLLNRFKRFILR